MSENVYTCKACERPFATAKDFSDHFKREGDIVVGCKDVENEPRKA